jgi:hypothetical protein
MKKNRFTQVTTLVMSLLVIYSGRALSFSSNNSELSNRDKSTNSPLLIAQESLSVGFAVAVAAKVLNRTVSVAETVVKTIPINVPSEYRDVVLPKLRQAQQSMATAQSSVLRKDNAQVATAVSIAIGFMGEAAASAKADAGSVQAISTAIVKANQALAIAQAKG